MGSYTQIPPGNYWGAVKQFFDRGGFVNGLNPTVVGRIWYVSGEQLDGSLFVQGSDSNTGRSPNSAFATIARAFEMIDAYDIVVLAGVFREQLTAPIGVNDITLVGAGNRPRAATSSNVANGGGAYWRSPAALSNTLDLLLLNGQGWILDNIFFNNAATTSPAACVQLLRDAETPESDASHTIIRNCIMTGGSNGLNLKGGPNYCDILNNIFYNFVGAGDTGIAYTLGAGQGTLNAFRIMGNSFFNNVNHIVVPFTNANIYENFFSYIGQSITTTLQIVLTGGQHNLVWENKFGMATTTNGMAAMFGVGTVDSWGPNHFSNAVQYGSPLTTA